MAEALLNELRGVINAVRKEWRLAIDKADEYAGRRDHVLESRELGRASAFNYCLLLLEGVIFRLSEKGESES